MNEKLDIQTDEDRLLHSLEESSGEISNFPRFGFKAQTLLTEVGKAVTLCVRCPLYTQCTMPVPGDSNPSTGIVLFGRNPGRQEDKEGKPFIGPGGAHLWAALNEIGIVREMLWVTNMVKCYTQNDVPPTSSHRARCSIWWKAEFALIKPSVVIALGNDAFSLLMGVPARVMAFRKKFQTHSMGFKYVGVVHPGAAVRRIEFANIMREDLVWVFKEGLEQINYRYQG